MTGNAGYTLRIIDTLLNASAHVKRQTFQINC